MDLLIAATAHADARLCAHNPGGLKTADALVDIVAV
jgi:hypothetical protein